MPTESARPTSRSGSESPRAALTRACAVAAAISARLCSVSAGLEASPGVAQGFFVGVGSEVHASFLDSQNSPSQQSTERDMLNAPPMPDDSVCEDQDPNPNIDGTQSSVQQNGNINVRPRN